MKIQQLTRNLSLVGLLLAGSTISSQAAITFTAVETGGDVVISSTGGTINTMSSPGAYIFSHGTTSRVQAIRGHIVTGITPASTMAIRMTNMMTAEGFSMGVNGQNTHVATSSTGAFFGINRNLGYLVFEDGYTSGDAIGAMSATYSGQTLASLGIKEGTSTTTFGSGGNTDSVTLVAIAAPEPSATALLGMAGLCLVARRRR